MTGLSTVRTRLLPIVLSQAFGLLCGVAGVKLATELVPPLHFGTYGIFISFAPLGMWVVHAGIIKFVGRHWAAAQNRPAMLRTAVRAMGRKLPWLAVATGVAAGTLAGAPWLAVFGLLFIAAVLHSWAALGQAALQAERRHWGDFGVAVSGSLTRSFAPPLFYAAMGGSLLALFGGFALHALVVALAAAWALHAYFPRNPPATADAIKPVYTGPLFIALAIAGWVMAGLQRWIIGAFFGATDAGYFTLAANLATLIPAVLGTIALQYFQPVLYAAADSETARRDLARMVDRIALLHAVASVLGLLLLRLIAPRLIGPLISERYAPAIALLLPAGAAMLALVTGWFYHAFLLAAGREHACGKVDLTSAAIIAVGSLGAAAVGESWLLRWMIFSPLVPWLVNRPLARRQVLTLPAGPGR